MLHCCCNLDTWRSYVGENLIHHKCGGVQCETVGVTLGLIGPFPLDWALSHLISFMLWLFWMSWFSCYWRFLLISSINVVSHFSEKLQLVTIVTISHLVTCSFLMLWYSLLSKILLMQLSPINSTWCMCYAGPIRKFYN